jgi:2-amino-4-hydroxy-6-hydroxymethyldihydropteridine diphosphokinase
MYERGFVMVPLAEIAPDYIHPDGKTSLEHLSDATRSNAPASVKRWDKSGYALD